MILPSPAQSRLSGLASIPAVCRCRCPRGTLTVWAQWAGEVFPTTHALRIVRGILLKGNTAAEILPELWPIALFTLIVGAIAIWSYRETLD